MARKGTVRVSSVRNYVRSSRFHQYRRSNNLEHEKANKLVGLFHNLRLLKRMKEPRYTEPVITEKSAVTGQSRSTSPEGQRRHACHCSGVYNTLGGLLYYV